MNTQPTNLAWRVENASADEADVFIYDVIGDPYEGTTAKTFVDDLRALTVSQVNLRINSPGGFVSDGLAMYNAIQQHPANITAYIESEAASAASFVAMGADDVLIAKNAKIFIHNARGFAMGAAADMRTLADMLDEESENIASIYADKTGKPASEWREAMSANKGVGTTYRGQAAVDVGLADAIAPVPVKSGRNVQPLRAVAQAEESVSEFDVPEGFGRDIRKAAGYPSIASPEALEALLARQIASESIEQSLKRS